MQLPVEITELPRRHGFPIGLYDFEFGNLTIKLPGVQLVDGKSVKPITGKTLQRLRMAYGSKSVIRPHDMETALDVAAHLNSVGKRERAEQIMLSFDGMVEEDETTGTEGDPNEDEEARAAKQVLTALAKSAIAALENATHEAGRAEDALEQVAKAGDDHMMQLSDAHGDAIDEFTKLHDEANAAAAAFDAAKVAAGAEPENEELAVAMANAEADSLGCASLLEECQKVMDERHDAIDGENPHLAAIEAARAKVDATEAAAKQAHGPAESAWKALLAVCGGDEDAAGALIDEAATA